ncbi:MAG: sulfite reductase [Verrucomicrobia bacterium]|nr:sulfite reductase [Verrucomicrobiota bacterium]MDE3047550.1 sulfite reductase [Verrucomicrobiota bacterium]
MYSRIHPYISRIKERSLLTGPGSSKKTYHIVLDLEEALPFKVGDSIGVIPSNDAAVVDRILQLMGVGSQEEIEDPKTGQTVLFRDFLLHRANISKVSFHKLFPVEKTALPLLELLQHHKPGPRELSRVLLPLLPRFYSIASSTRVFPNEVHLTVSFVHFELNGQTYFGVGSYFLCVQAEIESTPIPIYVQPSNHFTLPEDPNRSIIMIGPGTGVAPFRAFMQERMAGQAEGRNWLFFGERNRETDFYYGDYWLELEKQGRLRLSTAFSRDQAHKIYVQHKMLEEKKSLWEWIEEGAILYVCGDAEEMAKDVDAALQQIAQEEGGMSEEEARKFLKTLRHERRYVCDVY